MAFGVDKMALGPLMDVGRWLKAHNPGSPFKKRHLSFLTIHYLYLISLGFIGSILIFPAGGLKYIDALYFAAGAATQSGLNPVDFNKLNTYQQVVLYLLCMVATPIFINTFVVFVRLYWFQKRFQHVAREARNLRRTRSRQRTNTQGLGEKDPGKEERGVNGRSIVVLHGDRDLGGATNVTLHAKEPEVEQNGSSSSNSSDTQSKIIDSHNQLKGPFRPRVRAPSFRRDITFADALPTKTDLPPLSERLPQQMSAEQHIAFLENQRNPKDKGALRIPGPREFDRGIIPETLSSNDDGTSLSQQATHSIKNLVHMNGNSSNIQALTQLDSNGQPVKRNVTADGYLNGGNPQLDTASEPGSDDHPMKRNITIDDSNHPRHKFNPQLPSLTFRKTATTQSRPNAAFDRALSTARPKSRAGTFGSTKGDKEPMPYLSWQPTIGRNSAFVDLTEEQREELGGIEYRSLKTLAIILISYYLFFHLLGVVTLIPWILRSSTWGAIVDADGQSRVWWGIFTPATCFNDLGFTLTPDSMISFQLAVLPLLLGAFLIIIGNTGFPCMLRFLIWIFAKLVPRDSGIWEELKFLLDHPRRCFTLLFPADASWWLFWILVLLNAIDVVFFIILDLDDPVVTSINPPGFRVLDGLFQAASTRTAGLSVVNLANLHPGIQVSYLIMMYISVFPIAISVRRTNVYEEKSLGIYGSKSENDEDDREPSYIGAHLRRQLSFDLWYIFLGFFVIAIAEGGRLQDVHDVGFTMFAVLFEIVSAYGTVGLSLGYPTINASFSAEFTVLSKLVIIAMQIRGRHRGLPYELDRAILLPSEALHKKEDQDAANRMPRRGSTTSVISTEPQGMRPLGAALSTATGQSNDPRREHLDDQVNEQEETIEQHHKHHARGGLGKMMAKLASHPTLTRPQSNP